MLKSKAGQHPASGKLLWFNFFTPILLRSNSLLGKTYPAMPIQRQSAFKNVEVVVQYPLTKKYCNFLILK